MCPPPVSLSAPAQLQLKPKRSFCPRPGAPRSQASWDLHHLALLGSHVQPHLHKLVLSPAPPIKVAPLPLPCSKLPPATLPTTTAEMLTRKTNPSSITSLFSRVQSPGSSPTSLREAPWCSLPNPCLSLNSSREPTGLLCPPHHLPSTWSVPTDAASTTPPWHSGSQPLAKGAPVSSTP